MFFVVISVRYTISWYTGPCYSETPKHCALVFTWKFDALCSSDIMIIVHTGFLSNLIGLTGNIPGIGLTNEKGRCYVMHSLIGWGHTQNGPCLGCKLKTINKPTLNYWLPNRQAANWFTIINRLSEDKWMLMPWLPTTWPLGLPGHQQPQYIIQFFRNTHLSTTRVNYTRSLLEHWVIIGLNSSK